MYANDITAIMIYNLQFMFQCWANDIRNVLFGVAAREVGASKGSLLSRLWAMVLQLSSAALSDQCCWEKMLEQGRKMIEVMLGGKKKRSPREGRRGWSADLSWDRLLLMTASNVGQGWKMTVATTVAIVKEDNSGVSGEGAGDGNDKGRERWWWRREEGSEDYIDDVVRSSVIKVR
ncbi:hypothetical protein BHE74_00021143 [Ensete ventricosum]|nr:hypothetical protein BHE74_00021143 [Ensete ventricosum]